MCIGQRKERNFPKG
ncbi:hypothetical protein CP02DC22_0892A, partial [Chlamydia psittaci 02DC22]